VIINKKVDIIRNLILFFKHSHINFIVNSYHHFYHINNLKVFVNFIFESYEYQSFSGINRSAAFKAQ
jgi:hypothetical protein